MKNQKKYANQNAFLNKFLKLLFLVVYYDEMCFVLLCDS